MKRYYAFTLVELLVVISILALLMAILLPSLSRARSRAKTAICLTNVRGLAQATHIYGEDWNSLQGLENNPSGGNVGFSPTGDPLLGWDYRLLGQGVSAKDYLNNNGSGRGIDKLRFCPETSPKPDPITIMPGTAHLQWDQFGTFGKHYTGSYALNNWLVAQFGMVQNVGTGTPYYAHPLLANGATIPVFVDSAFNGMSDNWNSLVPPNLENPASLPPGVGYTTLTECCINRHNMAVNVSFLDGHAETTKLGDLWILKWTANWPRTTPAVVPAQ
jgi:prepilin-type N-terminal cleavage/methylation domain-containing protein/prepilin-type processing-associated H-X9-DG protein